MKVTCALLPWGAGGALAACALNAVWLGCMIFLQTRGSVVVQAGTYPVVFRVSVGAALLLTLAQIPIALAITALAAERHPGRALVAAAFYFIYITLNVIGYTLYGRLAPLAYREADPVASMVGALVEVGHPLAVTGVLPLFGYGLLGVAWGLLATALWHRGGLWRATAGFLFASGVLSVIGGIGAFVDHAGMMLGCMVGGGFSLPALGLLTVGLWRAASPRL